MLSAHLPHTKCRLPYLFDCCGEAKEDFFGGSDTIDLGQTTGFAVKVDEWLGLGLIEVKSTIDGVWGVVVALHHVSPTVVATPLAIRVVSCLIVGATVTTHTTQRKTIEDQFTGDNEIDC
jgi:hypothetical protein